MKYLVIDGNYLGHRARFSHQDLSYKGQDTGVIFGFLSEVINLCETFRTNKICFIWDSRESKRKEIFPEYKEKRKKRAATQEEKEKLFSAYDQMSLLRTEILPEIGFQDNFMREGFEGDDLMAKLVRDKKYSREEFILVTSDEDMYQVLDDCDIYKPGKGKYTYKDLREEYNVSPKEWELVKAIGGCKSDEVPGIPGIGEKTISKWLRGELGEKTVAYKKIASKEYTDIIERNKKLVILPFEGTKKVKLKGNNFSPKKFKKVCKKYGMRSFIDERMDEWERLK